MTKLLLFLSGTLFLFACKTKEYFMFKGADCSIVFSFERSIIENQEFYFIKSKKMMFKNQFLDIETHFPESTTLKDKIEDVIKKNYKPLQSGTHDIPSISDCKYFSKEDTLSELLFSDYFFNKDGNNDILYIVYSINGDVFKVKSCSESDLERMNHRYSCPIVEDLLDLPFFVLTDIKDFRPPESKFLKKNNYQKSEIKSIKLNYCD